MNSVVLLEISVAGKSLVAYLALEWLLASVLPLVDDQVHFRVIPLWAAMMGTPVLVYHFW